jgi:hypothetical protein
MSSSNYKGQRCYDDRKYGVQNEKINFHLVLHQYSNKDPLVWVSRNITILTACWDKSNVVGTGKGDAIMWRATWRDKVCVAVGE